MSRIIPEIVSQHAEEAAFLWLLRDHAARAPHYALRDLAKLDGRVEAHLDGLRVAGPPGWEVVRAAVAGGEAGEVFAAAVSAFEAGDEARIRDVVGIGSASQKLSRGLISAIGWLPPETARRPIESLLGEQAPGLRRVGIAAAAVQRQGPGRALAEALADPDPSLRARALRAVGELGAMDHHAALLRNLGHPDVSCRFAAAWSAALLSEHAGAIAVLKELAGSPRYGERAVQVALRRMRAAEARAWIKAMALDPARLRLAVIGAGVVGDPATVPWLIERMKAPALARVAGEAFAAITGVEIAYEGLDGERPEGFESGPTEDPADEDVRMDPDQDLTWPDPEAIRGWWERNRARFSQGTRHLLGRAMDLDSLRLALQEGRQRQRAAAALELAIRQPGRPLFEVRAPGFRQRQALDAPAPTPGRSKGPIDWDRA